MGRGSRVDGASFLELGAEPQEDTVASSWVVGAGKTACTPQRVSAGLRQADLRYEQQSTQVCDVLRDSGGNEAPNKWQSLSANTLD